MDHVLPCLNIHFTGNTILKPLKQTASSFSSSTSSSSIAISSFNRHSISHSSPDEYSFRKNSIFSSGRGASSRKCKHGKFKMDLRDLMHSRFKVASPFSPFTFLEQNSMNLNRPSLALQDTVYYFAFGSNMGMEKLTTRGGGIKILSYEPAYVENYRLAFNLLAFPPFEPTMASIEPENECITHGVLVELEKSQYDILFLDEGGGLITKPYLEEVVVAKTYSNKEIQAISFRTNRHSTFFLPKWLENPPSRRYLNLLINGATDSGVESSYIEKLKQLPAAFELKCPFSI